MKILILLLIGIPILILAYLGTGVLLAQEPPVPASVSFSPPSFSVPIKIDPGSVGASGIIFRVQAVGAQDLRCTFSSNFSGLVSCRPVDTFDMVIEAAALDLMRQIEPNGDTFQIGTIDLVCQASFMDIIITPIRFDDDSGNAVETGNPIFHTCGNGGQ